MNKKGFFYTLDAILAIVLLMSFVTAVFFFMEKSNNLQTIDSSILNINYDSLAILEKDNTLENNDLDRIDSFLNNLPKQICANITFYDSNSVNLNSTQRDDCELVEEKEVTVARRSVVRDDIIVIAEMRSWFK
jgi:hypothetical protein